MALGSRIPPTENTVYPLNTTAVYKWYTDWLPALALDKIKTNLKAKNVSGNHQCRVACQTAATRGDNPDSPTQLESSWMTGMNERCSGILDITANTNMAWLVRFGVAYNLTSGSTPGSADVGLEITYDTYGRLLGSPSFDLFAADTSNYYRILGPWMPAIHVDKVKAAIIVHNASTNFQCRLAVRTANTAIESPGAWTTTFDAWHSGAGEFNPGELSPSSSSDMYIQLGLQYAMSSGTNGIANVTVHHGIRRS